MPNSRRFADIPHERIALIARIREARRAAPPSIDDLGIVSNCETFLRLHHTEFFELLDAAQRATKAARDIRWRRAA